MVKFNFPKSLKLKGKIAINDLFGKGESLSCSPLRIFYYLNKSSNSSTPKIAFSVSKKNFKRAVDRNLLKRKMREAFRLNKQIILDKSSQMPSGLEIMFLYTSPEICSYEIIQTSMIRILNSLKSSITR